jgi:hypothetical protein
MPIQVQTLNGQILSKLDAEGSDRYTFAQDISFAINSAIETVTAIFNQAFGQNKLSPESLRELTKVKVWQTNSYSRFTYNKSDTGHALWTIIGVYPKPKVNKGVSSSPVPDKSQSKFRGDLSYLSSDKSCKRLTLEEWNSNTKNVFMPGNTILQGELTDYAYLDFADYTSTSYVGNTDKVEIQVRPDISNELVALAYLKYPNQITQITDVVEFPESLTTLIVDIALHNIAYKQGDQSTLYLISDRSINQLVSLMK